VARPEPIDTRARLLEAATTLFAQHGFHRTTARDIAELAGVNLAAANYHFGSKRDLYVEVLRAHFAEMRSALSRRHAELPPLDALARSSRSSLRALLAARVQAMFEIVVGPPPGLHAMLMQREMTDPSEALPIIVDEFIRPMRGEIEALIAALEPGLDPHAVERCANSVIAQVLFYRFCRPALLQILGRDDFPRGIVKELTEHVMTFAIGGIERRARGRKAGPRGH
jgi:TetR/AcrR family transcriptional regulator, regulator of cefoperazone and chloramphenicol sensitivity